MPRVSYFHGIAIYIYQEPAYKRPHFHAEFAEDSVSIDLVSLRRIVGGLPRPQMKLVDRWCRQHHEELLDAWKLVSAGQTPPRIDPLP